MNPSLRNVLYSFLPVMLAVQAGADVPPRGVEWERAELLHFTAQLRDLPGIDRGAADEAYFALASAPTESVKAAYDTFENAPGWQEVPLLLSTLTDAAENYRSSEVRRLADRAVAGPAATLDPANEAEARREVLLALVTFFRGLAPLAGPEVDAKWVELEAMIVTAQPEVLRALADAFQQGMQRIERELGILAGGGKPLPIAVDDHGGVHCSSYCCERICDPTGILGCGDVCIPGCTAACDAIVSAVNSAMNGIVAGLNATKTALEGTFNFLTSEITRYGNEIANLANQVAGYVSQIGQFVTDAFNATGNLFNQLASLVTSIGNTFAGLYTGIETAVTGFLDQLIALVPTTPQAAFNLLTGIQLTGTAWVDTLIARMPVLDPPCPAIGTDIGPLGVMGTLASAQKSDGLAKITRILYDAAPADVPGIKAKLAAAAIYHPAEYWNLCARSRYAIAQFEAETGHRGHEAGNLDVPLSTRGTQTSVNAVSGSAGDVDGDVARVEGKITALDTKANELLRRLDTPLSTRTAQTSIDTLRGTFGTLDSDVGKIESKLDILQANVRQKAKNQSERQAALAAFEELITRLAIEDNLLRTAQPQVISQFQLPESYGGQLALVRSIVQETVAAMLAAGERVYGADTELSRGDALLSLGDFQGAYARFRKAYADAVKP